MRDRSTPRASLTTPGPPPHRRITWRGVAAAVLLAVAAPALAAAATYPTHAVAAAAGAVTAVAAVRLARDLPGESVRRRRETAGSEMPSNRRSGGE